MTTNKGIFSLESFLAQNDQQKTMTLQQRIDEIKKIKSLSDEKKRQVNENILNKCMSSIRYAVCNDIFELNFNILKYIAPKYNGDNEAERILEINKIAEYIISKLDKDFDIKLVENSLIINIK